MFDVKSICASIYTVYIDPCATPILDQIEYKVGSSVHSWPYPWGLKLRPKNEMVTVLLAIGFWPMPTQSNPRDIRKGSCVSPPTNICIYSWMSLTVCLYVQKIYGRFNCLLTYASNLLLFLRTKGMNDLGNSSGTGKQPIFPEEHHPKTDGRDASR